MAITRDTACGRTFPEHSAQMAARTFGASSKACAKLKTKPFLFLDMRGGQQWDISWQKTSPLPGESLTLNTGEYPREENASTLSQILQVGVPSTYFLSPKACQGILRRASARGKELPEVLRIALEQQASA